MSRLLLPALKLMNTLNFIGKFWVITLIVCLPLTWLAFDKVMLLKERIDTLAQEQWGVSLIQSAWLYQKSISQMSNLKLVAKAVEEDSVTQYIDTQRTKIERSKTELEQIVSEFSTSVPPLDEQWQIDDLTLSQMYAQAINADKEFNEWTYAMLGRSLLLQDQDSVVFDHLNELTRMVQPVRSMISNAAAYDAFVTAYGFAESSAKPVLSTLYDQLEASKHTEYPDNLAKALSLTAELYQSHVVETHLSGSFNFDPNAANAWYEHLTAYDSALELLDQRVMQLLSAVQNNLDERVSYAQSQLIIVMAILLCALVGVLYFILGFYRSVKLSIYGLMDSAERFSRGNFSDPIKVSSKDEMGELTKTFESMRVQISSLINAISDYSAQASTEAEKVGHQSGENLRSNKTQTQQISQVLQPMSELVEGITDVSNRAKEASQNIHLMQGASSAGREQIDLLLNKGSQLTQSVQHSTRSIKQVERETESIKNVLEVINGIAERTNLLALNAAIEAARAGEQGRGFAVVADEVRGLAQRVQDSTNEIESSIHSLTQKVDEAVNQMNQSELMVQETMSFNHRINESFQSINDALISSAETVLSIEGAAERQEMAAKLVNDSISSIDQSSQLLAVIANNTDKTASDVKVSTGHLQIEIQKFKA